MFLTQYVEMRRIYSKSISDVMTVPGCNTILLVSDSLHSGFVTKRSLAALQWADPPYKESCRVPTD